MRKIGKIPRYKDKCSRINPENTSKYEGKYIFLSSVTDPYSRFEKEYKLTRRIIKKLIPLKQVLGILTKSDLILRDLDLIKQLKIQKSDFLFQHLMMA